MAKNIIKTNYVTYLEQFRIVDTTFKDNFLDSESNINFSLEDNIGKDFSFKQLIDDETLTNPNLSGPKPNTLKNKALSIDKNFDNIEDPIYEIDNARSNIELQELSTNNKKTTIVKNKLKNIKL